MRIDLPRCNFKNCKYHLDCNCTSQNRYETCDFREAKEEVEVLNTIIKEDCGMLPDYEKYLGNKIRKEFAGRVRELTERTAFADCWSEGGFLDALENLLKEMEEK